MQRLLLGAVYSASRLSCSDQASLGSALFCFLLLALPQTHSWQHKWDHSRGFLSNSVGKEKVGKGQLAKATEIAARDSHMSSRKVDRQDLAVC